MSDGLSRFEGRTAPGLRSSFATWPAAAAQRKFLSSVPNRCWITKTSFSEFQVTHGHPYVPGDHCRSISHFRGLHMCNRSGIDWSCAIDKTFHPFGSRIVSALRSVWVNRPAIRTVTNWISSITQSTMEIWSTNLLASNRGLQEILLIANGCPAK